MLSVHEHSEIVNEKIAGNTTLTKEFLLQELQGKDLLDIQVLFLLNRVRITVDISRSEWLWNLPAVIEVSEWPRSNPLTFLILLAERLSLSLFRLGR